MTSRQAGARGATDLVVPCLTAGALGFTFLNHAPLIPFLVREAGITPSEAGFLSGAMFLSGGALAVPLGRLTDRLGARRVLGLSLATQALSALLLALAPSYAVMIAAKLASGIGFGAAFVAGAPYVAALADPRRHFLWQGLYGGSVQFGIGSALMLLPLVATRAGWRAALAASALPPLAMAVAWAFAARGVHVPGARRGIASVLADVTVWRLGLVHSATFSLALALGTWIAAYFVQEFGLSLSAAGALGSLGLVLGIVGRPAGGFLVTTGRIGSRALILATLGAAAAALVVLAVPDRPLTLAVLATTAAGLATSLCYAAVVTLATRTRPADAGAALGLIGAVSTVGGVVGPPLIGALLSRSGGFSVPFGVMALLPALTLLACLGLREESAP